ncbi:protein of unknown function [Denitratisoma oestradiolicum]|uniref:Uncharacterized protein n=1 Tax=Denitratisoma oestradiolicum TaxID=311182 RepID=A0A6S6XU33_9PROT|nr:protein of unknown function [Denitratisoma oestradiolicum]
MKARPPSPPSGGFDTARFARYHGALRGDTEGLRLAPRAAFPWDGPAGKLLFDGHGKARPPSPPSGGFDTARSARYYGALCGGAEGLRLTPRAVFPWAGPAEKLLFDGHEKARPPSPPSGGFDTARFARYHGALRGGTEGVRLAPPAAFPVNKGLPS